MGLFKKNIVTKTYDKENKKPVIKARYVMASRLPDLRIFIQVR